MKGIYIRILDRLELLEANNIEPKALVITSKSFAELGCNTLEVLKSIYGMPIYHNEQIEDFLIGV